AFEAAKLLAVEQRLSERLQRSGRRLDVHDLGLVVAVRGRQIDTAAEELVLIVRDEVDAVGFGVDRVGEETNAADAERLEDRLDRILIEVAGVDDAVVDVDVEVVGGELEIRQRLPDESAAVVLRFLRLQIACAE